MHEWALAEAIVDYITKVSGGKRKFKRVTVKLGELQSIDEEILRFSMREILKADGIYVNELRFERDPAVFRCRNCGHEWSLKDMKIDEEIKELIHFVPEAVHTYFKCPKCGSRDFEIVGGRGVYVVEVIPE